MSQEISNKSYIIRFRATIQYRSVGLPLCDPTGVPTTKRHPPVLSAREKNLKLPSRIGRRGTDVHPGVINAREKKSHISDQIGREETDVLLTYFFKKVSCVIKACEKNMYVLFPKITVRASPDFDSLLLPSFLVATTAQQRGGRDQTPYPASPPHHEPSSL